MPAQDLVNDVLGHRCQRSLCPQPMVVNCWPIVNRPCCLRLAGGRRRQEVRVSQHDLQPEDQQSQQRQQHSADHGRQGEPQGDAGAGLGGIKPAPTRGFALLYGQRVLRRFQMTPTTAPTITAPTE